MNCEECVPFALSFVAGDLCKKLFLVIWPARTAQRQCNEKAKGNNKFAAPMRQLCISAIRSIGVAYFIALILILLCLAHRSFMGRHGMNITGNAQRQHSNTALQMTVIINGRTRNHSSDGWATLQQACVQTKTPREFKFVLFSVVFDVIWTATKKHSASWRRWANTCVQTNDTRLPESNLCHSEPTRKTK